MWHCSKLHQSPSCTSESTSWPLPIRRPSRTRGSRYGALLIDSMPPATAISMSPVAIPWAASITAFSPEPQTLLIVIAATRSRQAAIQRRLPCRVLTVPGLDDVAHDAFVDAGRIDPGARHRLAHDERAELRRGEVLQRAEELAGGRADGGDDD